MTFESAPTHLAAPVAEAIRTMPDSLKHPLSDDSHVWLGRTSALMNRVGMAPSVNFEMAIGRIGLVGFRRDDVLSVLYKAYHDLAFDSPGSELGTFIPPGDTWNGYAALVRLVQKECDDLLIVDPYVSANIFIELLPHAVAKVATRILTTNQPTYHAPLVAASNKWQLAPPIASPIEGRYAAKGQLHDRLIIIDSKEVWLVSQSIKDIAKKSAASVFRVDAELAQWKVQHYEDLWEKSTLIS